MSGEAAEWLKPRLEAAPPELAAAIRALLDGVDPESPDPESTAPGGDISAHLAAAALRGFEDVLLEATSEVRSRGTALRLLAADAALTYAFEAAADPDADLEGLAGRLGPRGVLGERLAAAMRDRSAEAG